MKIKNIYGALIFENDSETLRGANLIGADLRYADLSGADLSDTDLRYADLSGADLSDTDLRYADLRYADLSGADLSGAIIQMYCKWNHGIVDDKIKIGCKVKSIDEWDEFFKSDKEFETKRGTEDFKRIEAIYLAYKAYLTHLNK